MSCLSFSSVSFVVSASNIYSTNTAFTAMPIRWIFLACCAMVPHQYAKGRVEHTHTMTSRDILWHCVTSHMASCDNHWPIASPCLRVSRITLRSHHQFRRLLPKASTSVGLHKKSEWLVNWMSVPICWNPRNAWQETISCNITYIYIHIIFTYYIYIYYILLYIHIIYISNCFLVRTILECHSILDNQLQEA